MSEYTKKRIAEISGLQQRQVQFYTEQGVVTPEIDAGEGRGKTRLYSDHNLVQFMVIKGLAGLGMTISKMRPILRFLDLHQIVREYEKHKLHKGDTQLYIKIFKKDDGTMAANWEMTSDASGTHCILKPTELSKINECIVINFGRIAGGAEAK